MTIAPELRTYRDALNDLTNFADRLALEMDERRARRAVKNALRELGLLRDWKYYRRFRQINLVAPFTGETGATIAYDHTGGATCERQLTFTPGAGETLPTWARDGEILLANSRVLYPIAERRSGTVLQLPEDRNPGADVAAGSFTLHRGGYPLDGDVTKVFELNDERGIYGAGYIHPSLWLQQVRSLVTTQDHGFQWTVLGDDDSFGQLEFRFCWFPGSAQTVQFLAQVMPRRVRYTGYGDRERSITSAGIAANADDVTITGTGTAFTADMVGSVLRISEDGTEPDLDLNPPAEQKIITAVDVPAQKLTVHSAVSDDYTGAGFVISDPLDVPEYLSGLFEALCRVELSHLMDRHDRDKIDLAFQRALWSAQERDENLTGPSLPVNWVSMKIPTFNRIVAVN